MRLAVFNVHGLFERFSISKISSLEEVKSILQDFGSLSTLIEKEQYSEKDKKEMLEIMRRHKGLLNTGESKYIRLNKIQGRFLKKKQKTRVEFGVNGRGDWIGGFELKRETIKGSAIENIARVIIEVNADVLGMIEVESRDAMNRFNNWVIPRVGGRKYDCVSHGGSNVGIMTRLPFYIESQVDHADDTDSLGKIFNGDCIEYMITTPWGDKLLVILIHFKREFHSPEEDDDNIERQAKRVREIYEKRLNEGFEFITVAGDLDDTPEREPLKPLLGYGSNLIDIMYHPNFLGDGRLGTQRSGSKSSKVDYILMSPKLANRVPQGGIERRGVWAGTHGDLSPHFSEIRSPEDAASDHAALWAHLHFSDSKSDVVKVDEPRKDKLKRYPYAMFPRIMHLHETAPLEVMIKVSGSTGPLSISVTDENRKDKMILIDVMISSLAFEIVDPDTLEPSSVSHSTSIVPFEEKDSDPIMFLLKAKKEGLQNIDVKFYQNGTYLGKFMVTTDVLPQAERQVQEIRNVGDV